MNAARPLLVCAAVALCGCGGLGAFGVRPVLLRGAGSHEGEVTALAVLELRSSHERFGGLSGIELSADGRSLWLVSDRGHWLVAQLDRDPRGALRGLHDWRVGPLLDLDGRPLTGSAMDAEGLTRSPDGGWLVSFEQHHRIWHYAPQLSSRPRPVPTPAELRGAPANSGLEAIVALADGRLVLISEGFRGPGDTLRGWIGRPGSYDPFFYVRSEGFVPTDLAVLPEGDLLVLERRFTLLTGVSARIRRVSAAALRPGARVTAREIFRVRPPLAVDNFEGLAVERREGATYIYIVSDDNFSALQRTLLYQLRLDR